VKTVTGRQNGLMGLAPPRSRFRICGTRDALLAILLAGLSLYVFHRLAPAPGARDVAVRDSETRHSRSDLTPSPSRRRRSQSPRCSRGCGSDLRATDDVRCAGLVPFSQSILFLLAVISEALASSGSADRAAVTVMLPELLSHLADIAAVRRTAAPGGAVDRA